MGDTSADWMDASYGAQSSETFLAYGDVQHLGFSCPSSTVLFDLPGHRGTTTLAPFACASPPKGV